MKIPFKSTTLAGQTIAFTFVRRKLQMSHFSDRDTRN